MCIPSHNAHPYDHHLHLDHMHTAVDLKYQCLLQNNQDIIKKKGSLLFVITDGDFSNTPMSSCISTHPQSTSILAKIISKQ